MANRLLLLSAIVLVLMGCGVVAWVVLALVGW